MRTKMKVSSWTIVVDKFIEEPYHCLHLKISFASEFVHGLLSGIIDENLRRGKAIINLVLPNVSSENIKRDYENSL